MHFRWRGWQAGPPRPLVGRGGRPDLADQPDLVIDATGVQGLVAARIMIHLLGLSNARKTSIVISSSSGKWGLGLIGSGGPCNQGVKNDR